MRVLIRRMADMAAAGASVLAARMAAAPAAAAAPSVTAAEAVLPADVAASNKIVYLVVRVTGWLSSPGLHRRLILVLGTAFRVTRLNS
jgi:hypothetical protein